MYKKLLAPLLSALVLGGACAGALAQTVVSDAWVRATVNASQAGGAYLTVRSPDAARLVKATSPLAASVEIHTMDMQGTMMRMREVPAVELPAGQPVSAFHVMLMGLKQPLKEGQQVPLVLEVERVGGKRETVKVSVPVKALTYKAPAPAHSMAH